MSQPHLITVKEANQFEPKLIEQIYADHISPGQLHYFRVLGFNDIIIQRASGVYYYDQHETPILDFACGAGCAALGHNHPRIVRAKHEFQLEERYNVGQWFYSQYVAALSKNLASISPGDLNNVLLYNIGSEAIESALKIVEKYQGSTRNKFLYTNGAFHGRTRGALSVTDSDALRDKFLLVGENIKVPFGSAEAIERALREHPDVGGVILEPVQGGAGVVVPPNGYLRRVREICDQNGVLLILDEIQCGLGRCGSLFAFETEKIIPDLVAVAKPLSGAQVAISGLLVRKPVFSRVMANKEDWYLFAPSTFGGMGEACITAMEMLQTIIEDNLLENVCMLGEYFLGALRGLQKKYPKLIKEVRGRGFMIGVEFHDLSQSMAAPFQGIFSRFDQRLKGGLAALIVSVLLRRYNIIVGLTGMNPNVLRLHPPYITERKHIDYFISSLDQIMGGGLMGIAANYVRSKF